MMIRQALGMLVTFALATSLSAEVTAEVIGSWDITSLKTQVPAVSWLSQDQPIHSLVYDGEIYAGVPTKVFAFYASPITLGKTPAGTKFPGVVLIHGGGGTAFAQWVQLWAERGYAAIAMDLSGSRAPEPQYDPRTAALIPTADGSKTRERLAHGGPDQGHGEKFDSIGGGSDDDWPFHAAASVIRAHTLLRSFAEVDPQRTAVTGISWGGYTTCLVASLDDRFKAAVPVYGCGFLHEGESVQKPSIDKLGDRAADWVAQYDPGSLLPRCRVPILFVNGTNDIHYPLDSMMKTFAVVTCEKQLRVAVNMRHGHAPGWTPIEIGLFIDSKCRGGLPLAKVEKPTRAGDRVQVRCTAPAPLKKAELNYSIDGGLRSKREWTSVPATITDNVVAAAQPPTGTNTWFFTITDERDAMVSSEVIFEVVDP